MPSTYFSAEHEHGGKRCWCKDEDSRGTATCRRHEIENGTMEFLFVSLFQWAKTQGHQGFNLGLSALSGVGEQAEDPAFDKVMHWIYEHVDQFHNFKGLHLFKEKFHPKWSSRFLIYRGTANLAPVWLAVMQSNSGDRGIFTGILKRKWFFTRTAEISIKGYGGDQSYTTLMLQSR